MKKFFIGACLFFIIAVGAYLSKNYWLGQTTQSVTNTGSIVLSTGTAQDVVDSILTGLLNIEPNKEIEIDKTDISTNSVSTIANTDTDQSTANEGESPSITTKEVATVRNIDSYFANYSSPIDKMFRYALIDQGLDFIDIPNHDNVSSNPQGVINIDGGYRFTIGDKDEVCKILKFFGRLDLPCYDPENGADIFIAFSDLGDGYVQFNVIHYVGMGETYLINKKYKISDILGS